MSVSPFTLMALVARQGLLPRRESLPMVTAGGLLDMSANILYLLAIRQGPLAVTATPVSFYPASTIHLARIVLGERLRLIQRTGMACAIVAIALIVSR